MDDWRIDRRGWSAQPGQYYLIERPGPDREIRSQPIGKKRLAGLQAASANVNLDLHLFTPFRLQTRELAGLDGAEGASANVNLDLHVCILSDCEFVN